MKISDPRQAARGMAIVVATTIGITLSQPAAVADHAAPRVAESQKSEAAEVARDVAAALTDVGAARAAPNPAVAAPLNGEGEVIFDAGASSVEMGIPAEGAAIKAADGVTRIYDGAGEDTAVAIQPTAAGVRALVNITSPDAPEEYAFPVSGDVTRLALNRDGSVTGYDRDNLPVTTVAKPWAVDARGVDVPTHFEVRGTTLTQVVEHRAGNYTYGIVADPNFLWWAKNITKCVLGVAAFFGPGAASKMSRLKAMINNSNALKAVVDKAGGIKKVLDILVEFVKKKGKVSKERFRVIKDLARYGGWSLLDLVSGGCTEIVKEIL